MAAQVFLSHSSDDQAKAETICARLEARGIQCWMAPRDVAPGTDYGEQIIDAIESTRATVLILSDGANQSTFVKNEVERALTKGKPIIPFRISNVQPSRALELFISRSQWIDAWTPPLEARIQVLATAIQGLLSLPAIEPEAPAASPLASARPPAAPAAGRTSLGRRRWAIAAAIGAVVLLVAGLLAVGVSLPAMSRSASSTPTTTVKASGATPAATQTLVATSAPTIPTGVVATATDSATILVSWTAVSGASGYKVSDSRDLVEVSGAATSYAWTLTPGTYRCFHVAAFNTAGSSGWSSGWACATAPGTWTGPATPTGVAATAASPSEISITWTDKATTETGYRIRRWDRIVWATLADGLPANATSYTDSGLASSEMHEYQVCAYNSGGESCSDGVSATTS